MSSFLFLLPLRSETPPDTAAPTLPLRSSISARSISPSSSLSGVLRHNISSSGPSAKESGSLSTAMKFRPSTLSCTARKLPTPEEKAPSSPNSRNSFLRGVPGLRSFSSWLSCEGSRASGSHPTTRDGYSSPCPLAEGSPPTSLCSQFTRDPKADASPDTEIERQREPIPAPVSERAAVTLQALPASGKNLSILAPANLLEEKSHSLLLPEHRGKDLSPV